MINVKKVVVFTLCLGLITSAFLPFVSFARPPVRSNVLGAILGGDGTTSSRTLRIDPISNYIFGLSSDVDLELCTRLYLWFRADTNIRSFTITLNLLSTQYQLNTSANNKAYMRLCEITGTGTNVQISNNVAIANNVDITYNSNSVTYQYLGEETGKNGVLLVLTFQNYMLGSQPMYFQVTDFTINGDETVFTTYESTVIDKLTDIYNAITYPYNDIGGADFTDVGAGISVISDDITNQAGQLSDFIEDYNIHSAATAVLYPSLLTISSQGGDFYKIMITIIAVIVLAAIIDGLRRIKPGSF